MTSLKKAQAFLGFLMAAAAIGTVVLVSRPAPEPIDRFWFWVGIVGGPLAMAGLLWLFIGLERARPRVTIGKTGCAGCMRLGTCGLRSKQEGSW